MSETYYILKGHEIIPVDWMTWAVWFEEADAEHESADVENTRRIGWWSRDGVRVSTVFLGMEHGWDEQQRPLIFETMVFKGEPGYDEYCERYATYDEALAGHMRVVEDVKRELNGGE
jgi:hypothetical protein